MDSYRIRGKSGFGNVVKRLIQAKAAINSLSSSVAARNGHEEVVCLFLDYGAELMLETNHSIQLLRVLSRMVMITSCAFFSNMELTSMVKDVFRRHLSCVLLKRIHIFSSLADQS